MAGGADSQSLLKRLRPLVSGKRRSVLFQSVVTAILLMLLWQTAQSTKQEALAELREHSLNQLSLYVSNLQGRLQKYQFLPRLLATDARLRERLLEPNNELHADWVNRYLEAINDITGTSDIYLMDATGLTLSASNWRKERPFIGRNFSYRPYFTEAIEGRLGKYFALGSTSKRRGYYYSYPLNHQGKVLGVIAVKIDFASIEKSWGNRDDEFIVTDPDGIIFVATKKAWLYKATGPLNSEILDKIRSSRRYPGVELRPLDIVENSNDPELGKLVDVEGPQPAEYLMLQQYMPSAGWTAHILARTAPVELRVIESVISAIVMMSIAAMFGLIWLQRHNRLIERERLEQLAQEELQQAHDMLEIRVEERTGDLQKTNIQLSREIDERRRAEETLRQTQDELIHAAKMAVLGQMATGISHELNQPLAAIRTYADNARALLDHQRPEDVRGNLHQISELTDRMAQISAQFKAFARKTKGQLVSVSLVAAIDHSLKILAPKVKEAKAIIRVPRDEDIYVTADSVQLEQVLINLIGNALQAVESREERRVTVEYAIVADDVVITVHDTGPGIEAEALPKVFDPFFTTKEEGLGLGLGLSISHRIVTGMNGKLTADNHENDGAIFTLTLPKADQ